MVWFILIALSVWAVLQHRRIDALVRRVGALELELFKLRTPAKDTPIPKPAPAQAPAQEPLLLTQVVPDDVLVLDNPIPAASNDANGAAKPAAAAASARPQMQSPLLLDKRASLDPPKPAPPLHEPDPVETPKRKTPAIALDRWLAEKGLAWVAGIAIALGAIYLVSLATQATWFTAPVRLASASLLGVIVLGASEWTRRIGLSNPPGHPLASSLLAGAGVVVFYAIVWAAHGIYGFIGWPATVALLALCAAGLVALSTIHGQALGVLAIALALLAPALASSTQWPWLGLTTYVGLVAAAGFVLATIKRWAWVAIATVAGLYFWFVASIAVDDLRRGLAIVSFATLGGVGLAFRKPPAEDTATPALWTQVRQIGPSIVIGVSSTLIVWAWLAAALSQSGAMLGVALISAFHVALAGYAVRERAGAPVAFAIAAGALAFGLATYLRARFPQALDASLYPAALTSALLVIAAAIAARPHRTERTLVAAAGSISAAVIATLTAFSRPDWHSFSVWAPLIVGAGALFAAGWRQEADVQARNKDLALDFWGGGAAALMMLAVESALPELWRTVGHAGVALLLSIALVWRGWRVFGYAALTAAAFAAAHALAPNLIGASVSGGIHIGLGLLIFALSAAILFAASTLVRRKTENTGAAEALSAASVIVALTAAFVLLRWIAAGGAGITISPFTEASLRVAGLMAAGLTLMPRIHESPGFVGQWRGHALLAAGLLYALVWLGLATNPWWGGAGRAVVSGPPVFNALPLAFLVPAGLAFLAANRLYPRQLNFARFYGAAGAVLTLIWAIMEIRYLAHRSTMAEPGIGLFECACYALVVLAFALGVAVAARMRARKHALEPFTHDLMRVMRGVAWVCLSFGAVVLLLAQHPIWGGQDSTASNAFSTLLAVFAQFVAVALVLLLGRALSVSNSPDRTRFAAAATAATLLWSAGHAAIRWTHHRGYMDDQAPLAGLEGLLHAIWPLVLVVAAAQLTRIAPGRDTVRSYLYDLQALWSAAIWTALAFAGLGFWLLYNPWWGAWPAQVANIGAAVTVFALCALAAALSLRARNVPHAKFLHVLAPASVVACAAHLFVLLTLLIRWLHHGDAMGSAASGGGELWIYSAVWALFAAVALALGTVRNDAVLRWIGLGVFAVTILKVMAVDTSQLSGAARAASVLGLGAAAAVATWMARRKRPAPEPTDLVTVRPSARRERRHVRRRTSP